MNRLEPFFWGSRGKKQGNVTYFYVLHCVTTAIIISLVQSCLVRWDLVRQSSISPSLSFLPRSEGIKGRSTESEETQNLIGPQTANPAHVTPNILLVAYIILRKKKTERALLPLVTTASGRKGRLSPLVHFDYTPPVGQQRPIRSQYLRNSGITKRN